MRHTRPFILSLLVAAAGCATIESGGSSLDEQMNAAAAGDGDSGGDGDGTAESTGGAPDDGSGGVVVVAVATGGEPEMGGADPGSGEASSSTGGGPTLLPSCVEDTECDDFDPCTDNSCNAGSCDYVDNGTCECTVSNAPLNCNDDNPCTDDACVDRLCVNTDNTAPCEDDGNVCTADVCDAGACTHTDTGFCSANTITIRSVRDGNDGQWITVGAAGLLVWNVATAAGQAALFERVDQDGDTFKLRDVATDLFVIVNVAEQLEASGTEEAAAIFHAPACPLEAGAGVALRITTDDDALDYAAAEPGGELNIRSGGCTAANASAWERFEIINP